MRVALYCLSAADICLAELSRDVVLMQEERSGG